VRRVLTPKWWVAHVLLLVAIGVMLRLGLWQWHRANSPTGGLQNYAYALQWPVFAIFALVVYGKTLLEEVRREPGSGRSPGSVAFDPEQSGVTQQGRVRVGVSSPDVVVDADDGETLAWNARLAALNAATAAVESRGRGR
jgi:DNA-binding transcriptional regulator of glucitol operon